MAAHIFFACRPPCKYRTKSKKMLQNKIGFRVLICCFGRVKLRKLHPCLTIKPLLQSNSATIRV